MWSTLCLADRLDGRPVTLRLGVNSRVLAGWEDEQIVITVPAMLIMAQIIWHAAETWG